MPSEGRKFRAVDTTWRRTMEKVAKNPEAMVVASDEELLKNLQEANKLLDLVQKGLSDYLETKRLAFPRSGERRNVSGLWFDKVSDVKLA